MHFNGKAIHERISTKQVQFMLVLDKGFNKETISSRSRPEKKRRGMISLITNLSSVRSLNDHLAHEHKRLRCQTLREQGNLILQE